MQGKSAAAISGSQQAAVLLLMMGEEKAAEVLRHVGYEEVEKIGVAMAAIRDVDSAHAAAVCNRFQQELTQQTPLGVGAQGYMRNLLVNTMGEQTGSTMADRLLGSKPSQEFDSLKWMELDTIVQILRDEHPQIIAITLAHLEQRQAANILAHLAEDVQEDVLYRIANMDKIPEAAMQQLQSTLKAKLDVSTSFKAKAIDGASTAAGILNALDDETEMRILETLAKSDESLRSRLEDLMFVFANLADLDNKGMQLLLREVTSEQLAVALKGADETLREKVYGNMSKRAREILIEDMEARGPIKISDVEEAQKAILGVAKKMADDGQISLSSSSDGYLE